MRQIFFLFLFLTCFNIGYSQANRTIYSQNDTIILVDTNLNVIIDDLTITTNCPQEKDSNLEWTVIGPWKHTNDGLEERNTDEVRAGVEAVFKGLSRKEEKNQQVAINIVNRLVA